MLRGRTTKIDYPYYPFRISVDYVLVSRRDNLAQQLHRSFFEKAARREGLLVHHDFVGPVTFTLISAPFHRLCKEAEKLQCAFPLKNCTVDHIEPSCCQILSWIFVTRERLHLVSAPFQRKFANLFVNYTEEPKFFTHAQREMLTHQVLSKVDISRDIHRNQTEPSDENSEADEPLRRRGLEFLLMEEAYEDAFVLHQPSDEEPYFKAIRDKKVVGFEDMAKENEGEDPRQHISERWTCWWKIQPLSEIRDYFGEQIAFYFAWQGTFLTLLWPATIAGIAVFVFGFFKSVERGPTVLSNCTTTAAYGSRSTTGDTNFSRLSSWFLRAFDNEMNAIFAAFMSVWGSLFYQIWRRNNSVLAFSWDCEDIQEVEPDRPEYVGTRVREDPITGESVWINPVFLQNIKLFLSAVVVALCMGVVVCSVFIVTVYKMWAAALLDCNTQSSVVCSFLVTYLPSILNTISTMVLGTVYQWIVEKLNNWENHRTHSEHHNALVVKLFAFQLVNNYTSLFYVAFIRPESHGFQQNGLFGLGPSYKDTCCDSTCGSLLAVQLLSHMLLKPVPKFAKDIVLPYFYREYREATMMSKMQSTMNDVLNENDGTSVLVREWMKPDAGRFAFWEFNEKVLLFGTTMMFAALFPLAPLLALIIGLADLRVDASRLLWFNRKPVPATASGIGIWLPILSFLMYTAVMTNAFIIAFTSDFCTNFYGASCDVQTRLIIVIVFQNSVFVLKYMIQSIIPTLPSSIRLAQRRQRFVVSHIIDKGDVPNRARNKKLTRKAKLAWLTSRVGVDYDVKRLEKKGLDQTGEATGQVEQKEDEFWQKPGGK